MSYSPANPAVAKRLELITQLPYHQFLGLEILNAENGKSQVQLLVNEQTANPNGMLHGGIIYSIADVSAYIALLSKLAEDPEREQQDAVTHDIHVSVFRPVTFGNKVLFNASISRLGKTLAFMDTEIVSENKVIATARVTKTIIDVI